MLSLLCEIILTMCCLPGIKLYNQVENTMKHLGS